MIVARRCGHDPVRDLLAREIPVTASIVFGGVILYLGIAIPTGIISALRPRSVTDRAGMVFVLFGVSAPSVWVGLMLLYLVGFRLGWTPINGYCGITPTHEIGTCGGFWPWMSHLILPWITLAIGSAAFSLPSPALRNVHAIRDPQTAPRRMPGNANRPRKQ